MMLTAKEMHNSPAKAYREAYKEGRVTINHDRYPDKVFELTARDRAAIKKEDDKNFKWLKPKPAAYVMTFNRFVVFKWADRDAPAPFDSVISSHNDLAEAMRVYKSIDDCYCSCVFDCETRTVIAENQGTSIFV